MTGIPVVPILAFHGLFLLLVLPLYRLSPCLPLDFVREAPPSTHQTLRPPPCGQTALL